MKRAEQCPHSNTVTHPKVPLQQSPSTQSHLLQHTHTHIHAQTHNTLHKKGMMEMFLRKRKIRVNSKNYENVAFTSPIRNHY